MDQLMVRLPGPVAEGARVTLIGRQGEEEISPAELAAHIGGVAQELSTALTGRIARQYTIDEEEERICMPRNRPCSPAPGEPAAI